jgi:hypothetical protein
MRFVGIWWPQKHRNFICVLVLSLHGRVDRYTSHHNKHLFIATEKKQMKTKSLLGSILASSLVIPASGQVSFGVTIGAPPPPLRYEAPPPMPGPGYVWVDGYWVPEGGRWVWRHGEWRRPPYAGAYWAHPHYDHYPDGWHVHDGYWSHDDHSDHYWDRHPHH